MALAAAGAAAVAIWLDLFLGRGRFWVMRETAPPALHGRPSVTAVVPARNEAAGVGRAVASLAGQNYPGPFHVVLADDASVDGTAEVARGAALESVLTVIQAPPLPDGWTGKLWAVAQGIRSPEARRSDYLLLTDADIVHPPDNLTGLVARAESGGYDLVSYMATLECRSWAERTLVPAFVFFFFMLYPPAWIGDPRRRTAGAAGGCMLIRRSALERIGGIEAIRGELIDDCALASAVKRTGGKVWLGLSRTTRSLRRYGSFGEIAGMISRTAFTQLRYSAWLLAGTIAAMTLTYVAPVYLAFTHGAARIFGASAWLIMCAAYLPVLRYYGRSVLWAPLLPLVAAFYMGTTVRSAVNYWSGRGGMWKGRAQAKEVR